jgi:hypothetical protein
MIPTTAAMPTHIATVVIHRSTSEIMPVTMHIPPKKNPKYFQGAVSRSKRYSPSVKSSTIAGPTQRIIATPSVVNKMTDPINNRFDRDKDAELGLRASTKINITDDISRSTALTVGASPSPITYFPRERSTILVSVSKGIQTNANANPKAKQSKPRTKLYLLTMVTVAPPEKKTGPQLSPQARKY